jgi:hypothetical protein
MCGYVYDLSPKEFLMFSSNDLLVSAIRQKAKDNVRTAAILLLCFPQKYYPQQCCVFLHGLAPWEFKRQWR